MGIERIAAHQGAPPLRRTRWSGSWPWAPDTLHVLHWRAVEHQRRMEVEAEGLQHLAARLAVASGAREVLRVVLDGAPSAMGASSCAVLLPAVGGGWVCNRGVSMQSMRATSWRPAALDDDGPESQAVETGRAVVGRAPVPDRDGDRLGDRLGDREEAIVGAFPVVGRNGAVVAVFSFRWHRSSATAPDLAAALEAVGVLCGEALQRGALHDRERSARVRTAMLQRATVALARARRIDDVVEAVALHGAAALGVARARLQRELATATAEMATAEMATAGTVTAGTATAGTGRSGPGGALREDQVQVLPVAVGGVGRAELQLVREPADPLQPVLPGESPAHDRAVDGSAAAAFAELCAQSLERCRLAEVEHGIAVQLQHAMLGRPDEVDDLRTAMVYLPSESGLEVGGDWADVVRIPRGRIALVIGDVVGHSIEAATVMGQLRSAVRALVGVCASLPELLGCIDGFAAGVDDAEATTLAVLIVDPADGTFEYLCAGHPPLLHRRADGSVVVLAEGRNAPLGCEVRRSVAVGRGILGPGDLLLLYTDGLVERRRSTLDDGLGRLVRMVGDLDPDVGEFADAARSLVSVMLEGTDPDDDVCLLLVAPVRRPGLHRRFRAEPRALRDVRRALRSWCEEQGLSEAHETDVLLVAGEALANAVEHAYAGRTPGPVTFDAAMTPDGAVTLRVCDQGAWRRPVAADLRGHGSHLMRSLSSQLEVDRLPTGTIVRATVPPHAVADRP